MEEVSIIGIDLAKRSFQVHGAKADGSVAYRKKLSRGKLLSFLASQPPCTVAMEACASAHYWGREIVALGHEVRLVPPIYVRPFVKRQKNDTADAEAISEAAQRPTMRLWRSRPKRSRVRGCSFARVTCWCASAHRRSMPFGVTSPSSELLLRRAGPGSGNWPGCWKTGTPACRRRSSSWDGCCSGGSTSSPRRGNSRSRIYPELLWGTFIQHFLTRLAQHPAVAL